MFFLSGLPRSGSTLLAAILNQRPDVHVTQTSGLIDIFGAVVKAWDGNPSVVAQKQTTEHLYTTLRGLVPKKVGKKKIVVDKSRGWVDPAIQSTMGKVLSEPPRIVATVRDVASCAASFVKLAKPGSLPDFLQGGMIRHLKGSYMTLRSGYEKYPDNILFVEYENLVSNPEKEIRRIEAFWGLQPFAHNFTEIDGGSVVEDDENAWGMPGLHRIQKAICHTGTDPETLLGEHYYKFQAPKFWRGETEPKLDILDTQLHFALQGKLDEAGELSALARSLRPTDDRAAFNRGWYELRKGNLKEGFSLLDRGRKENLFGNPCPSAMPRYEGQQLYGKTVLLVLEGGLGDQIHSARWVREIAARGGTCVVSCAPELAPLLSEVAGVSAVVESKAAGGVYHQFHVMGMSGFLSFLTVNSSPYIPCKTHKKNGRIGLRWAGNPQFEHEQHRVFDPAPLFKLPGTLVSLQRDEGAELATENLERPILDTWLDTKAVIEGLDKVITSCTSVAHLAAAMGKETWIIVPILPYYLWADGKSMSIWYKNVKLFRQMEYGDWSAPMREVVNGL